MSCQTLWHTLLRVILIQVQGLSPPQQIPRNFPRVDSNPGWGYVFVESFSHDITKKLFQCSACRFQSRVRACNCRKKYIRYYDRSLPQYCVCTSVRCGGRIFFIRCIAKEPSMRFPYDITKEVLIGIACVFQWSVCMSLGTMKCRFLIFALSP